MIAKVRVRDLEPNPFRNMAEYPIDEEKIARLVESIKATGFWPDLLARRVDGKMQLAYGVHRRAALRKALGPDAEIEVAIAPLSDEDMLQIMSRENMTEWGTSTKVTHETVKAAVQAIADGRVTMRAGMDQRRFAPGFAVGDESKGTEHPYTATALAAFLGYPEERVEQVLTELDLMTEGLLREKDLEGQSPADINALVREAARVRRQREQEAKAAADEARRAQLDAERAEKERARALERAEAERKRAQLARDAEARQRAADAAARAKKEADEKAKVLRAARENERQAREEAERIRATAKERVRSVVKAVSEHVRAGRGRATARVVAEKAAHRPGDKHTPNIDAFAYRTQKEVAAMLERDQAAKALDALVKERRFISPTVRIDMVKTLVGLSNRSVDYAKRIADVPVDGTDTVDVKVKEAVLALPSPRR